MISVKELQIGDWVLYANTPMQIEDIKSCDKIWLNGGSVYNSGEYIDPIPLTKEILEKNDILYQFGQPWYQGGNKSGLEFRYCSDDRETEVQIPIRYVHELQHALRICKINKKIVL